MTSIRYMIWTGPWDSDWESQQQLRLRAPVPPERWPCGPPAAHEDGCNLFARAGEDAGLYCDCVANDVDAGVGVDERGRRPEPSSWGKYARG